jgi:hypothetical protein
MAATATAAAEWFATSEVAATATTAATAAAAATATNALLMPKPSAPEIKPVTAMPDPLEQRKAQERSIIEQLARRGRSASILTGEAATLGGG